MKILLTGRAGQVGFELEKKLVGEIIATDRSALDLEYVDSIREAIRNVRPDVIVNTAAYTAVDRAEAEEETAFEVNGIAPGVLAEEAKRLGALLVHFSTDYVFDGKKNIPYVEGDAPNPINAYGRTKLEGERRVIGSGCRYLIVRTSWVYAPRGNNFFVTIARNALAGEPLRVVADQRGVPTGSGYIAASTVDLVRLKKEGLFNVVPAGETTWHGFAKAIVESLGLKNAVNPIPSSEYPTPARRPKNSVLDIRKLSDLLGARSSWQQGLARCLRRWSSTS